MKKTFSLFLVSCMFSIAALAQEKIYDLSKLYQENKLLVYNRTLSLSDRGKAVKLSENSEAGHAWLKDFLFSNGTIEIDLKGKDVLQGSFIGIAFHGVNDSTYDAIYFRPFNFHAKDSVRKIHAVQYISHPEFGWERLRRERNGEFEKALVNPPDANAWFHARIVVEGERVTVFVNDDKIPSLVVKKLNDRKTGSLAIWVGASADGEFKNLMIKPQ
jgi:hypothetical protein